MDKKKSETAGSWLQLTIICNVKLTDAISDYLIGVLGASVEFGVEDLLFEQKVHAFLESSDTSQDGIADIVGQLSAHLAELSAIFELPVPKITAEPLIDTDWTDNWKKYFKPFAITPGLVIKPSWETYSARDDEQVIEMDPGMAFGTGHHATTSLCMDFIRDIVDRMPADARVLDVGTGTGILAMAAALFGASEVLGIDNDPQAVMVAAENVAHNHLQEKVEIDGCPLASVTGRFSLVVANIIQDVLRAMVDDLSRLTAPGGSLILSGILAENQAESIVQRYGQAGFKCTGKKELGEWAALHLVKEG